MDALITTIILFASLFALLILGLAADPSSREYRS